MKMPTKAKEPPQLQRFLLQIPGHGIHRRIDRLDDRRIMSELSSFDLLI